MVRRNLTGVANAGNATQKKAAMDALIDNEITIRINEWTKTQDWRGYQQPAQ
jgi:hypothetical protein